MNFLERYLVYSSGNEVSQQYHKWSALAVISALVGRKVWVSQGHMARIYANTYTVLVGEPASGKSSAMDLGRFLLSSIGNVNMAPAQVTLEALLKEMGKEDSGYKRNFPVGTGVVTFTPVHVSANELITFLGAEPTKMIGFLTDVYDREVYENLTKGKGHDNIRGPYITLLGCMTPSVVDSMQRAKMITGGFSRRVFFVNGDRRGPGVPRPIKTPEQEQAKIDCIKLGKQIQNISGEFQWSDAGGEFFDDWYLRVKQPAMNNEIDPMMQRWYAAKDVLLLKLTMILTLANEKPSLVITPEGLSQALTMLDAIEKDLPSILGGAGRNVHAAIATRIKQYIASGGKLGRTTKQIRAQFYTDVSYEEIDSIMAHLTGTEQLKAANIQVGKVSKPGFVVVED